MKSYPQLKQLFERLSHLRYIDRIIKWDDAVIMPSAAAQSHTEALVTLQGIQHTLLVGEHTQHLISTAEKEKKRSVGDDVNFTLMKKRYLNAACVPLELVEQLTQASSQCEHVWRKMRAENNWQAFYPYLQKVFQLTHEVAKRRAQVFQMEPYDCLIDLYAPGFTQQSINALFTTLKQSIPTIMRERMAKQAALHFLVPQGPFLIEKQKALGLQVMQALQFNFQQGRLDISHHPFSTGNSTDTRITTRYVDEAFFSALFAICHETGHALYEQGLPEAWCNQPINQIDSMAMHESQSLLIEREVCGSYAFMQYLTPLIQATFGHQPAFECDNLFKMTTRVEPTLIRINADEVTYPLHIILRYEIEQKLFAGEITIKDLPAYWDESIQQLLGLSTRDNDREGVMQDIHWPSGYFGYFPAYALGRLIAAQFFAAFYRANPQTNAAFKRGNFVPLIDWLRENIHQQGNLLTAQALLKKVTGCELDPKYFIENIRQYGSIINER